ncbi:unnamed protein product [Effrenium voratum]|nr:unnamed protein product [Effrenium voratum]
MARILVDGEARALAAVDAEQTEGLELEEKDSLAEAFAERFQKFARRPCLGWRGRAGVSYKWMSYGQFFSETRKIASALSASLPPGSLIGICGANSLDFGRQVEIRLCTEVVPCAFAIFCLVQTQTLHKWGFGS